MTICFADRSRCASALANSYNVPTVKLLAGLGVDEMLDFARKMGIQSLQESSDWYGLSLTLGGGEVTLLDLATAYHTLANEGQYLEPRSSLTIRDSQGRLLEELPVEEAESPFCRRRRRFW